MARVQRKPSAGKPRSRFSDEYGLLLARLIAARVAAGVTQEEVAQRLNKTQSHISKCERREREINIVDLLKWCDAISISFSAFMKQFEGDVRQLYEKQARERQ